MIEYLRKMFQLKRDIEQLKVSMSINYCFLGMFINIKNNGFGNSSVGNDNLNTGVVMTSSIFINKHLLD